MIQRKNKETCLDKQYRKTHELLMKWVDISSCKSVVSSVGGMIKKNRWESNLTPQSRCIGTLWSHKFVRKGEGATTERGSRPIGRCARLARSCISTLANHSFWLIVEKSAAIRALSQRKMLSTMKFHGTFSAQPCPRTRDPAERMPLNIYRFLWNQILSRWMYHQLVG